MQKVRASWGREVMLHVDRDGRYDRRIMSVEAMKQRGADAQPAEVFGAADSERAANIVDRFARAFVERGTWAAAYRACYDCAGMKPQTVWNNAHAMSHYPGVIARVRELKQAAAERTICTVAEVLALNLEIATANPAEIVRTHRHACRYCHGLDGAYQWKHQDEFALAVAAELDAAVSERRVPKLPSDTGGYGFTMHRPPNPDCEHCGGHGDQRVSITPTDELSGSAAKLFKCAKQDRFGAITVELHDQQKALAEVARSLGAYKDSLAVTPKTPPPAELPADLPPERVAEAYLALVAG
jgi:phage terminase small subunit